VKVSVLTGFAIRDMVFSETFPATQVDGFVQKLGGVGKLTDKILSLTGENKAWTSFKD
jgi:hypothetical protein